MESLLKLKPSEIRFMQDSIGSHFQDGGSVNEAAKDLWTGRMTHDDFPKIKVKELNSKFYSFNNRRLYVFRVAECRGKIKYVNVKIVRKNHRFTSKDDGREVKVRGYAETLEHCQSHWLLPTEVRLSPPQPSRAILGDIQCNGGNQIGRTQDVHSANDGREVDTTLQRCQSDCLPAEVDKLLPREDDDGDEDDGDDDDVQYCGHTCAIM